MIIVDDCSSDDTDKIVSKYQKRDSRIKYYRLANNSGAAVARTVAMRLASGKYIAFWIVMICGCQISYLSNWTS